MTKNQNLKTPPIGSATIESVLKRIYYGPNQAASYSSAERLYDAAKSERPDVTRKRVKDWLRKQVAYTRHKKPRLTFPRRKVLTLRQDYIWASDLIVIDSLVNVNDGYQYIVTVVDLFSRKLWTRKIKQKSKIEMEKALRSIIEENEGKSPYKLWTDEGTEFLSLKDLYQEMEIERYSTRNPKIKSAYAERMNKTIQDLLYKAMTARNTARWIDLLDDVTYVINNRVSSVLHGLTPNEAHDPKNEEYLRAKFLEDHARHKKRFAFQKPLFAVGDGVRLLEKRNVFTRGYEPSFSKQVYAVKKVQWTYPITYKIEGKQRAYYSSEMVRADEVKTPEEKNYFVEKTRKVRTKTLRSGAKIGGETQYLLKAKNDPEQSSWITEFEYRKLKDGGYLD